MIQRDAFVKVGGIYEVRLKGEGNIDRVVIRDIAGHELVDVSWENLKEAFESLKRDRQPDWRPECVFVDCPAREGAQALRAFLDATYDLLPAWLNRWEISQDIIDRTERAQELAQEVLGEKERT